MSIPLPLADLPTLDPAVFVAPSQTITLEDTSLAQERVPSPLGNTNDLVEVDNGAVPAEVLSPQDVIDFTQRAAQLGVTFEEARNLREGDIKVEYHPASGKRYQILSHSAYNKEQEQIDASATEKTPWRGFSTRDDFELAEFVLEAGLNEALVRRLLKIIDRVREGESELTVNSYKDITEGWAAVAECETPVSEVIGPYYLALC